MTVGDVAPSRDLDAAAWLPDAPRRDETVAALLPAGFDAFARLPSVQGRSTWSLRDRLALHTATPATCGFGLDTAWGAHPLAWRDLPTFAFAGQRHLLLGCGITDLAVLATQLAGASYSPWPPLPSPPSSVGWTTSRPGCGGPPTMPGWGRFLGPTPARWRRSPRSAGPDRLGTCRT